MKNLSNALDAAYERLDLEQMAAWHKGYVRTASRIREERDAIATARGMLGRIEKILDRNDLINPIPAIRAEYEAQEAK